MNKETKEEQEIKIAIWKILIWLAVIIFCIARGIIIDINKGKGSIRTANKSIISNSIINNETVNTTKINDEKLNNNVIANDIKQENIPNIQLDKFDINKIPQYNGKAYITINNDKPNFTEEELNRGTFEEYTPQDKLGRCVEAFANLSKETMPAEGEERKSIGDVKPSAWHSCFYDSLPGNCLYNRCHLIAHELSDENANKCNLITGTVYLNQNMVKIEDKAAAYLNESSQNHILYRVTPIFIGNNLLASGVHMEAESINDKEKRICWNRYYYNVQPGVKIDYSNGDSDAHRTRK